MRKEAPRATPLLSLLRQCTVEEQCELAALAKTTRNYLYQLATLRRTPKVGLAKRLADASIGLHIKTFGRIPKLTIEQIASMDASCGGVS